MELTINGETKTVPEPLTVTQLLAHLQLVKERVAVEVNKNVVPRREHDQKALHPGDEVELVTFVGGG